MLEKLISIYVYLFAKTKFKKFNKLLLRLSLGGLGVLNYKTSVVSGEQAFLKKYLHNKNGTLIDAGANCGNYTKEAVKINPAIRVYAFEPHPKTYYKLRDNLAGYQNIFLINKGLSSVSGVLKLYDYPDKDGSSHASLFEDVITEIHGSASAIAHEVELTTIDEFVDIEEITEIILLKIDTEGNELEVLKGGVNTLSAGKIKAIHFEFNEMNIASRVFFKDFWNMLERYRFYRLLPNGMLEIKNYNPLSCEIFAYQNIVAILKE